jgi:hypothetical protein
MCKAQDWSYDIVTPACFWSLECLTVLRILLYVQDLLQQCIRIRNPARVRKHSLVLEIKLVYMWLETILTMLE